MKTELPQPICCDFELPVFDKPQIEPWPMKVSWIQAIRYFEPFRRHYMRHSDSPERRLKDKNTEPFRLE